jgi:hypothetical protein
MLAAAPVSQHPGSYSLCCPFDDSGLGLIPDPFQVWYPRGARNRLAALSLYH